MTALKTDRMDTSRDGGRVDKALEDMEAEADTVHHSGTGEVTELE